MIGRIKEDIVPKKGNLLTEDVVNLTPTIT